MTREELLFFNGLIKNAEIYSYILFDTLIRRMAKKTDNIDIFKLEYGKNLNIYVNDEAREMLRNLRRFYITPQNNESFGKYLLWLPNECYFSMSVLENLAEYSNIDYIDYVEDAKNILEFKYKREKKD